VVTAANIADVKVAPALLIPALEAGGHWQKVLADRGYRGKLAERLQRGYDCILELTEKLGTGFAVEPWRWVVERTFAWLNNARRLGRDYEELPEHHQAFVWLAMIRLNLRKLSGNSRYW
jgi:transposase